MRQYGSEFGPKCSKSVELLNKPNQAWRTCAGFLNPGRHFFSCSLDAETLEEGLFDLLYRLFGVLFHLLRCV